MLLKGTYCRRHFSVGCMNVLHVIYKSCHRFFRKNNVVSGEVDWVLKSTGMLILIGKCSLPAPTRWSAGAAFSIATAAFSMRSILDSKFLTPALLFSPCLGRCRNTAANEAENSDAVDDRVFEPPPFGGRHSTPLTRLAFGKVIFPVCLFYSRLCLEFLCIRLRLTCS